MLILRSENKPGVLLSSPLQEFFHLFSVVMNPNLCHCEWWRKKVRWTASAADNQISSCRQKFLIKTTVIVAENDLWPDSFWLGSKHQILLDPGQNIKRNHLGGSFYCPNITALIRICPARATFLEGQPRLLPIMPLVLIPFVACFGCGHLTFTAMLRLLWVLMWLGCSSQTH